MIPFFVGSSRAFHKQRVYWRLKRKPKSRGHTGQSLENKTGRAYMWYGPGSPWNKTASHNGTRIAHYPFLDSFDDLTVHLRARKDQDGGQTRFKQGRKFHWSVLLVQFIYLAFGIQVGSSHTAIIRCWRRLCQWFGPCSNQRAMRFRRWKKGVRNESSRSRPPPPTVVRSEWRVLLTLEDFRFKVCTGWTVSAVRISSADCRDLSFLATCQPSPG